MVLNYPGQSTTSDYCQTFISQGSLLPNSFIRKQNAFHRALSRYVNHGYLKRRDFPLALAVPGLARLKWAAFLVDQFQALQEVESLATDDPVSFRVPIYSGTNTHVCRMRDYLTRHLSQDLYGAYVHGALGSYEEISYSDFDALVILRHHVLRDPQRLARVARQLDRAQAIMLAQDPLQHHGWFVLTEFDLRCYCEAYFPSVLFQYAKALLPEKGQDVLLTTRNSRREIYEAFRSLSDTVASRIETGRHPRNLCELKGLLSQFMLLPALYVQVRDGRGVWKADSFDLAKRDFQPEEWLSMESVSRIRRDWGYELSDLRRWLLTRQALRFRSFLKRISPPIPQQMLGSLNQQFYSGMAHLSRRMQQNLSRTEKALSHLS